MPARGRGLMDAASDKGSPGFWRNLKSGDFVSVSDAEAFETSLADAAAGASGGLDYKVGDIRSFAIDGPEAKPGAGAGLGARAEFGEYRFVELQREGAGPLYLTLVELPERSSGPESFELRLYFIPAGLEPGTRDDYVDRGETWLFIPPPNPDDFISSELEYAPYPDVPEIDEGGKSRKLLFSRVGPGSLYGESLDTRAGVIINEYAASPPETVSADGDSGGMPANPLLLVLEEGWIKSDGTQPEEGGYLTVLLGKVMRASDLDYFPA
jgi:hypothetical protein